MKKKLLLILLSIAVTALCGCVRIYSESDYEKAKQQSYNQGFDEGYSQGATDQKEKDYEDLLIDGRSIRNIWEQVYDKYGISPSSAFAIVDEYEYDSDHGGYTWEEYQNALEVIYYTASIFPPA